MDRETWQATAHGVKKSWTRLSDFTSRPSLEDPSYLTNWVTFAKYLASVSVQITLVLFY